MSWFHLTVNSDLPVIVDLKAQAGSAGPEQRLFKIAQLVGLPAAGLSSSYYEIAEDISLALIGIEGGILNNAAAVPVLYTPGSTADTMKKIITCCSIITGRDMKAGKVSTK